MMEKFLTFLTGLGMLALILPFVLHMFFGLGDDNNNTINKIKESNWFIRIYLYYYPLITIILFLILLTIVAIYYMGKNVELL